MYYELYIDVFFFVNFIMDYLLLLLVRQINRSPVSCVRVLLGALAGALFTCLIVVLPIPGSFVKFMLFHCFINVLMIRIGLKIRGKRQLFQGLILLYVCGILLGGVLLLFRQYVRVGSLFGVLAIVSYHGASGVWGLLQAISVHKKYRCEVLLWKDGQKIQVKAIIDTGNLLRDSLTGKPVHILASKAAKDLFGEKPVTEFRYISYQAIGKETGVLPVFSMDRILILGDNEKMIENPLVAVCSEERFTEDCQLILNPEMG